MYFVKEISQDTDLNSTPTFNINITTTQLT